MSLFHSSMGSTISSDSRQRARLFFHPGRIQANPLNNDLSNEAGFRMIFHLGRNGSADRVIALFVAQDENSSETDHLLEFLNLISQVRHSEEPKMQSTCSLFIASLPTKIFQSNSEESDKRECAVCLDVFESGKVVYELPCSHNFHQNCLLPWLECAHTCPCCRLSLPIQKSTNTSELRKDSTEETSISSQAFQV